jgi:hypothetical protein
MHVVRLRAVQEPCALLHRHRIAHGRKRLELLPLVQIPSALLQVQGSHRLREGSCNTSGLLSESRI